MKPGEVSQIAIASAAFRAAHTLVFEGPTIHDDHYALELTGIPNADLLRDALEESGMPELPRASAFFALRHRFSEDQLLSSIERGVKQVVVLGAGLDSFALRNPQIISEIDFFEVDHPDTQQWKLERIDKLELSNSDVRYLSVDFSTMDLEEELLSAGLNFNKKIFFSCLGVTQYITKKTTFNTLGLIAKAKPGSNVVFDFIVTPEDLDEAGRQLNKTYGDNTKSNGEPWITLYSPNSLVYDVMDLGFSRVKRLTPKEAQHQYYGKQPASIVPMKEWQIIHATV